MVIILSLNNQIFEIELLTTAAFFEDELQGNPSVWTL